MSIVFHNIAKRLMLAERDLERARTSSQDLERALLGSRNIVAPDSVEADNALSGAGVAVTMIEAARAAVTEAHRNLATLYRGPKDDGHGGIYGCLGAHGIVQHSPDRAALPI